MSNRDEMIGVAHASDRVEAEMIQGLLESAGIPSLLQQIGVDGPQLGFGLLNPSGGSRRVLVRADRSEEARALLKQAPVEGEQGDWAELADAARPEETGGRKLRNYGLIGAHARIWAFSLGAMLLAFAVFVVLRLV